MRRYLPLLAMLTLLLAATPRPAAAEASGKTYTITVVSTVSGVWSGELTFVDDGSFVLKPQDGNKGTGMYSETVDPTTLNSTLIGFGNDGEDYRGVFSGRTTETVFGTQALSLFTALGAGTAGDLYLVVGMSSTTSTQSAAATERRRKRSR